MLSSAGAASSWPTAKGSQAVSSTINVSGTFDSGYKKFYGTGALGGDSQDEEEQDARPAVTLRAEVPAGADAAPRQPPQAADQGEPTGCRDHGRDEPRVVPDLCGEEQPGRSAKRGDETHAGDDPGRPGRGQPGSTVWRWSPGRRCLRREVQVRIG